MINKILEWLKMKFGKPVRYRVVNDLTQEYFEVSGADIRGCRIVADRECARIGWKIENMRSEEIL